MTALTDFWFGEAFLETRQKREKEPKMKKKKYIYIFDPGFFNGSLSLRK